MNWTIWVCSRCGFTNGPNRYCRDCGYARDPRPARILAAGVLMFAISLFIVGVALLMEVESRPSEFPLTQIGTGSLFVVLAMPLFIASIRMWSIATRIDRKKL